jgi:tRNA 2-selenouridine synthase
MPELFQRLMEAHYDPAYGHSIRKNYALIEGAAKVDLRHLDGDSLLEAARQLHVEPATV